MKDELLKCPFCGAAPEQYTIGERPQFGEKGQAMVRCKSGGCGMWGSPMSLDKWQKRANIKLTGGPTAEGETK